MADQNDKKLDDAFEVDSVDGQPVDGSATDKEPNADDALAAARADLEKAKKEYLYLLADFENYKTQVIKERSELVKYGSERLVVALLDVLDNFDRALSLTVTPENVGQFQDGMKMIAGELQRFLERFGVREVQSQNVPFNPAVHEALSSEETDAVAPGHITRVFRKAYKLHERVIRPGQVVVAKEPSRKSE